MTKRTLRDVVLAAIARELPSGSPTPADDVDLLDSGLLDSMGWVSVVTAVESATGDRSLGGRLGDGARSIQAIVAALEHGAAQAAHNLPAHTGTAIGARRASVAGWGAAGGARRVDIAQVEREFGMPEGKLRSRAGIESVCRVANGEDEVALAESACERALRRAGATMGDVDCVVTTSETFLGFPSLAASLHARLLADVNTMALDVGGGCLGVVNALRVAASFIESGAARCVLIATADVHSRMLTPARVKGEFGGLFGDGASAFVLRANKDVAVAGGASGTSDDAGGGPRRTYQPAHFVFGCQAAYASAVRLELKETAELALQFQGEALARAAVEQLEQVVEDLELSSGLSHKTASAFATHQPNPRLVDLLARRLGVPHERFPAVARTCGNLGASCCGMALSLALDAAHAGGADAASRGGAVGAPIFVASLGPGLLWGGCVLELRT